MTQAAVEEALRVGYRMIDTAASYLNEPEVGAGIAASGIDRSELFLQTKVWVSNYSYDGALHAFDVSTRKLGVDTVARQEPSPGRAEVAHRQRTLGNPEVSAT